MFANRDKWRICETGVAPTDIDLKEKEEEDSEEKDETLRSTLGECFRDRCKMATNEM